MNQNWQYTLIESRDSTQQNTIKDDERLSGHMTLWGNNFIKELTEHTSKVCLDTDGMQRGCYNQPEGIFWNASNPFLPTW